MFAGKRVHQYSDDTFPLLRQMERSQLDGPSAGRRQFRHAEEHAVGPMASSRNFAVQIKPFAYWPGKLTLQPFRNVS